MHLVALPTLSHGCSVTMLVCIMSMEKELGRGTMRVVHMPSVLFPLAVPESTWPHLTEREAGRCGLASVHGKQKLVVSKSNLPRHLNLFIHGPLLCKDSIVSPVHCEVYWELSNRGWLGGKGLDIFMHEKMTWLWSYSAFLHGVLAGVEDSDSLW